MAIKLQPNNEDAPIFTPNCYRYDWLIAKVRMTLWGFGAGAGGNAADIRLAACLNQIYVANAHAQLHFMKTYYLESIAVMEPFALSLQRQISSMHPVHRLLRPYLRGCIAANVSARRWLTGPTGILQVRPPWFPPCLLVCRPLLRGQPVPCRCSSTASAAVQKPTA